MEPKKHMPETAAREYTDVVRSWWDEHPFTLGLGSREANDLTGRVGEDIGLDFFNEVERKMRKWWIGATYDEGGPLIGKFVPYDDLRGKDVLDIAIGTGWSTVAFAEYGATVNGIDITPEAVRMTRRHLELKNLEKDVRLAQMDAQRLEFPDRCFDFVLAWGCYMWHMPDTYRALQETHRVLKSGATAVSYWYNKSSWTYWFNFMFLRGVLCGKLLRYRFNPTRIVSRYTDGSAVGGNSLTKAYSPSELTRMYRNAGFRSVRIDTMPLQGEVEGWPAGKFPVFKYLPSGLRRWMGRKWAWGLVVTAIA